MIWALTGRPTRIYLHNPHTWHGNRYVKLLEARFKPKDNVDFASFKTRQLEGMCEMRRHSLAGYCSHPCYIFKVKEL